MNKLHVLLSMLVAAGIVSVIITGCENDDDDTPPSTTTTTSTGTTLTAPTQLSPANGASFNHFPRTTTLVWSAVPGAHEYGVEVQYNDGVSWQNYINTTVASPTYTFTFIGAQPGRWRVWAIDSDGDAGPMSGWFEFTFTI